MASHFPKRPSGSSAAARFCQAVWDKIWGPEGQIINSDTVKVSYGTRGISLKAAVNPSTPPIFQAQIVEEFDNYLKCTLLSSPSSTYIYVSGEDYVVSGDPGGPAIPPGATVYVAKPFLLRRQSYDGIVLLPDPETATPPLGEYISANQRRLVYAGTTDAQQIWPDYVTGQVIDISMPIGGTGVVLDDTADSVMYQDENNDCRTWATEAVDCSGTTNGFRLVVASQFYTTSIEDD